MKKTIFAFIAAMMVMTMLAGCSAPEDGVIKVPTQDKPVVTVPTETENSEEETEVAETEEPAETGTEKVDKATEDSKPADDSKADTKPATKPSQPSKPAEPAPTKPTTPAETKPAHTHSYSSAVTTQPTCANAGVKTYTCSCGKSYTESVNATGNHNWVDHTATKQEYVPGATKTIINCTCGQNFNSVDAYNQHTVDMLLAGDTSNVHSASDSTIQEPGYYKDVQYVDYQYCSVCGKRK